MPLNPKGTMFPFNGDISGVVAAAGRCWGGGLPVSAPAWLRVVTLPQGLEWRKFLIANL